MNISILLILALALVVTRDNQGTKGQIPESGVWSLYNIDRPLVQGTVRPISTENKKNTAKSGGGKQHL